MEEIFAPERSYSLCIHSLCSEMCDVVGYCLYETHLKKKKSELALKMGSLV